MRNGLNDPGTPKRPALHFKGFDFDRAGIIQTLKNSGKDLDTFNDFFHRAKDLQHSQEDIKLIVVLLEKTVPEKVADILIFVKSYLTQ